MKLNLILISLSIGKYVKKYYVIGMQSRDILKTKSRTYQGAKIKMLILSWLSRFEECDI